MRDIDPARERDAAKLGMTVCATPAELAAQSDCVIVVVVDAAQVDSVLVGDAGISLSVLACGELRDAVPDDRSRRHGARGRAARRARYRLHRRADVGWPGDGARRTHELDGRLRRTLQGDGAVRAHMSLLAKDTALAIRAAQQVDFAPALGSLTAALFAQACEQGLRDRDDANLFEHLRGRRK